MPLFTTIPVRWHFSFIHSLSSIHSFTSRTSYQRGVAVNNIFGRKKGIQNMQNILITINNENRKKVGTYVLFPRRHLIWWQLMKCTLSFFRTFLLFLSHFETRTSCIVFLFLPNLWSSSKWGCFNCVKYRPKKQVNVYNGSWTMGPLENPHSCLGIFIYFERTSDRDWNVKTIKISWLVIHPNSALCFSSQLNGYTNTQSTKEMF